MRSQGLTGWMPARAVFVVTMTAAVVASFASTAAANHSTLRSVSAGPTGGNGAVLASFQGNSADGSRVFFQTTEALVAGDIDLAQDVYEHSGSTTTLISTAPADGNGPNAASFAGASADGTRVFFTTNESLLAGDTDASPDVYERSAGATTLLTTGPNGGNGTPGATFRGASADGTRVFFTTSESLISADTDAFIDIYERSAGTTTRLSIGPTGGNGSLSPTYRGASQDGTRVFFTTGESLVATDTDTSADIYERSGSTTTHISIGPNGGNGAPDAIFRAVSADGTRVIFTTSEQLVTSTDTDNSTDIYDRTGTTTEHISTGPDGGNGAFLATYGGASADATRVFFVTNERLVASTDTDSSADVYERTGTTTTHISTGSPGGNGVFNVSFARVSQDGARVLFHTNESLVAGDLDTSQDLYEHASGATTQISSGAAGGNGAFAATFIGASQDGARVFFHTNESLVTEDTDSSQDVYEHSAAVTTRLSFGFTGGNGAAAASFMGASADGTNVFVHTTESLIAADTDSVQDVYAASVANTALYPRPGSASPTRVAIVPAYQQCTDPNSAHPAPASPSCNPPRLVSDFLTLGAGGLSTGFLKLRAVNGDTGTEPDEADVAIDAFLGDVRNLNNSDYSGELRFSLGLRVTDTSSGLSANDPATIKDRTLALTVPCTPTAGAGGSNCSLVTSADTLFPGMVTEAKRTILKVGEVQVFDGGADGLAGTEPNTLYAAQGLFVP